MDILTLGILKMTLNEKLIQAQEELVELQKAYKRALAGQQWQTRDGDSTRSVTNQNLSVLSDEINKKKAEIASLENQIATGRTGRSAKVNVYWG